MEEKVTNSGSDPKRGCLLLFALPFMLIGAFIVLFSLNIIPTDDSMFEAPRPVVAMAGLLFFISGIMVAFQDYSFVGFHEKPEYALVQYVFAGILYLLFAYVANWVAFRADRAAITSTTSIGPFSFSSSGGVSAGKIVFVIGAIILDLLVVWHFTGGLVKQLRQYWEKLK